MVLEVAQIEGALPVSAPAENAATGPVAKKPASPAAEKLATPAKKLAEGAGPAQNTTGTPIVAPAAPGEPDEPAKLEEKPQQSEPAGKP